MQDKKQIIGLILSVVLSVGLVVVGVNAATTVGTDVSVAGDLAVVATTTLNGDVVLGNALSDNITFLGTATGTVASFSVLTATTSLLSIGGGPMVTKLYSTSTVLDFGAIAALACATSSTSLSGAVAGDIVFLGMAQEIAGATSTVVWNAWVPAADTVYVRVCNVGSSAATPNFATGTVRIDVLRH